MIGMLVTPYAEAAFGQLAQRSAQLQSFTHFFWAGGGSDGRSCLIPSGKLT